MKEETMIDFEKKIKIAREADKYLEEILGKQYDNFEQYAAVSKIDDLEVAKIIIKRLLDKVNWNPYLGKLVS